MVNTIDIDNKLNLLRKFFERHNKIGIAFSGGIDSAFLLYMAKKYAENVVAYYVKSQFQPQFEYQDALDFAKSNNVTLKIIDVDILSQKIVTINPANRCYYCKKTIFSAIKNCVEKDGISFVADGTNASDDLSCRPGMKAIKELNIFSPLYECGITKAELRDLAKQYNIPLWNKPSYACLATRIPMGTEITQEKLTIIEQSENFLFSLGLRDFRVRMLGNTAKIEVTDTDINKVIYLRKEIKSELYKYFKTITLDLEARNE